MLRANTQGEGSKWIFYTMCVGGFLIRLILTPISAHPIDMWNRYKAYLAVKNVGYIRFHDFPPLYYHFILLASFAFYNLLSDQEVEKLISRKNITGELNGWLKPLKVGSHGRGL